MKKYLEPIAMFMICLIIAIPIYSSSVYAGINSVTAYGAEGIPNFVSQQYDLTVEADVSLPSGNITPDLVKLKSGLLYTNFDSCASSGSTSSLCTVNIIRGVNSELEICPQTNFNVELYQNSYDVAAAYTKPITVKCDTQAPSISLSVSPQKTRITTILSYSVQDPGTCSGIDKIEFYTDSLTSVATLIPNSTSCSYSSSTSIDASAYTDGTHIIYLKAYDKIGNSNLANVSFGVDKTAPTGSASISITNLQGNSITYFTPQTVLADIVIYINDSNSIANYNLNYASLTATAPICNTIGTNIECRWDNLQIYMGNATLTKTIGLQATDIVGNNVSTSVLVQGTITQDIIAPTVSIGAITIGTTDGSTMEWFKPGQMKMSFSANITDDLSGIASISGDFSTLNVISGNIPACTGSGNSYRCIWSNLIFYLDSASYSKEIRVIATDNAGNEKIESKTASANYNADTSVPVLSNFRIIKTNNQNITGWIGNVDIPATISVDVVEMGSGLNYVKGYFNSINPSYTTYTAGTCTQTSAPTTTTTTTTSTTSTTGVYQSYVSNTTSNATVYLPEYGYTCSWAVTVHFNISGNPYSAQFNFNATDQSLNPSAQTFSQSFQVDLDGPIVSSLTTNHPFNNTYYVGADSNTFIVGITDAGVGINNSNVYLDLTGVGFANNQKATNCSGSYCYLYMLACESISEGIHTISVNTNTIDDLGNPLNSSFYVNVTADLTKPYLNSINATAVAATTPLYRNYILTGNALYIVVNITEATSLASAYGDFSNFISGANHVLADNCARQSTGNNASTNNTQTNYWKCIWSTDAIDITAYKKDNIYLNFTDVAGNNLIYPYQIEVLEAMTGNVSYWTSGVGTPSPSAIDRQIVTFYNPSMWFPASLVSTEGKSASERWPLEVSVQSCSDPASASTNASNTSASTSSVNYLSSANSNMPVLVNPNTDTPTSLPYNMYMDYELEQSAPTADSINITCILKIRTLVDQQKISPYEYKNISVTINYYNNPLGNLSGNVQDEIDDVKDGWLVNAEWIGLIDKILQIATTLCNLLSKLYGIYKVYGAISDALKTHVYTAAQGIVLGNAAGTFGEGVQEGWQMWINKFCKFLNCQLFYGDDWGKGSGNIVADWGRWASKWSKYWTPKDSLITSIVFLCIPGILYNLQKARIIDCQYINCLKLTAYGMPLQMCVKQRDYSWCKYVFGEIFNIIPFAGMISQFAQKIKLMLSQPAQFISVALKQICKAACSSPKPICAACAAVEGLGLILDVLCDLGIGSDQCEPFWKDLTVDDSVCKDALD